MPLALTPFATLYADVEGMPLKASEGQTLFEGGVQCRVSLLFCCLSAPPCSLPWGPRPHKPATGCNPRATGTGMTTTETATTPMATTTIGGNKEPGSFMPP